MKNPQKGLIYKIFGSKFVGGGIFVPLRRNDADSVSVVTQLHFAGDRSAYAGRFLFPVRKNPNKEADKANSPSILLPNAVVAI